MENQKKDLEEMRLLLESNMFEEITEDNIERLENFYTPFQIKLRIKAPLDNAEYNMALQYLGLRGFYEGHTIPTNPDNAAFMIKENPEGEKYIQTLIRKSMLDEIESFIEEDENFNQYMKEKCKEDFELLKNENDFISFALMTSGPSENFSHILTYGAAEVKNNIRTNRKSHIYIDNRLTEKEIEDYITPYTEGVKSSYERCGIALPGMNECTDPDKFTDAVSALRLYYKMCNGKNVITDDIIKIKNFMAKNLERHNIPLEYSIEIIAKNYISLRRISKYLFDEYYSLYDLSKKLKYGKLLQFGSLGEAEIISDLVILIKNNLDQILKEKEDREYK